MSDCMDKIIAEIAACAFDSKNMHALVKKTAIDSQSIIAAAQSRIRTHLAQPCTPEDPDNSNALNELFQRVDADKFGRIIFNFTAESEAFQTTPLEAQNEYPITALKPSICALSNGERTLIFALLRYIINVNIYSQIQPE